MERFGHVNKQKFVAHLLHKVHAENPKNRRDLHACAHFVADALRSSGVQLPDLRNLPEGHRHAYLYEQHLIRAGFQQVSCDPHYQPQVGDIMIWHPIRVKPTKDHPSGVDHEHGHMQAWLGHHWFSDFRQNTQYPWNNCGQSRCFVYRQPDVR